ncbi:Carboxypeptidase A4 [Nowakowskiella sp. JEL0078]|nr:Carboxypeptidase A4 [Nowakowskiella sp. JEL0078]
MDISLDLWSPLPSSKALESYPSGIDVLLRVPEDSISTFTLLISAIIPPISNTIVVDNIQSLIDSEKKKLFIEEINDDSKQKVLKALHVKGGDVAPKFKTYFTKYHTYSEITLFLNNLVLDYPDLVTKFTIGKTYEGYSQFGIQLGSRNSTHTREKKHLIFFGGEHAREWIGPASVQYLAASLLHHYEKDEEIKRILDSFYISIIPVLNVDGYIFTHEKNRMWRKNRQPNQIAFCAGTDINRNWGYKWGEEGSSSNPCSDAYAGPSAFSSPEIANLANYALSLGDIIVNFGVMYPYGADCNVSPPDEKKLLAAGKAAISALKAVHGTSFAVGSICNIIYKASGSSTDWAYEFANATYSYGVELRDTGKNGFILPPEQIIPSGEELVIGIRAFLSYILNDLGI